MEFRKAMATLADYPLYPYLEYAALTRHVGDLSFEDVDAFRSKWSDSPLATRLFEAWLDALFAHGHYKAYVEHYAATGDAARECRYLRALARTGRRDEAFAGVPALWVVGHSQPDACDPLFEAWIEDRHLTEELVWNRLALALENGQVSLARYLTRYLSGTRARRADAFIAVTQRPLLVVQTSQFRSDDSHTRQAVSLGLRRLARTDPEAAQRAWMHYEDKLGFAGTDARAIDQEITRALARNRILADAPDFTTSPNGRHLDAAEAYVVTAVALGEPKRALDAMARLSPEEIRDDDYRWRYWRGRAERAANLLTAEGQAAFAALARERQYYGFLAADQLGLEPQLNARALSTDAAVDAEVRALPGMRRVLELYALDARADARREWFFLQERLDEPRRIAATAALADAGWTDLSLRTTFDPVFADYLALRFPQPHRGIYEAASKATALPLALLYGISRQESLFAAAVTSPVGALGLMQLMPATAARTARSIGDPPPSRAALLTPNTNVRLGSRHLAMLMKRYDGNRYLSAAAYNAGEHRVDRWLREYPLDAADVWIDSIPFPETRNYVKAVMSFSYIYGRLLEAPVPFLTVAERGNLPTATLVSAR